MDVENPAPVDSTAPAPAPNSPSQPPRELRPGTILRQPTDPTATPDAASEAVSEVTVESLESRIKTVEGLYQNQCNDFRQFEYRAGATQSQVAALQEQNRAMQEQLRGLVNAQSELASHYQDATREQIVIDELVEQLFVPNRRFVVPKDCSTLCHIAMELAAIVQSTTRNTLVLMPLLTELRRVEHFASVSNWNPVPPVAPAPTPAPAVADTTPTRSPMQSIPENGPSDLFEELESLPATPTPPTDQ